MSTTVFGLCSPFVRVTDYVRPTYDFFLITVGIWIVRRYNCFGLLTFSSFLSTFLISSNRPLALLPWSSGAETVVDQKLAVGVVGDCQAPK